MKWFRLCVLICYSLHVIIIIFSKLYIYSHFRTSLIIAACNGQISMIRLLLANNADIAVKDEKGWTSDDYAVINGHHA